MTFNESEDKVTNKLIGYINCNQKNYLKKRIKCIKPKIIDVDYNVATICVIPQIMHLLVSDMNNNRLLVYDNKTFQVVRVITSINNTTLNAVALETNQKDRIYIANTITDSIFAVDLTFKLIQTFTPGNIINQKNQFLPIDIKYYNEQLYVCDFHYKRILKLNMNLHHEASYMLSYQPWKIEVCNNIACVRPNQLNMIYFYDIYQSFMLISKYDTLYNGPISSLNTMYFYQFNVNSKTFTCYDQNGKLLLNDNEVSLSNELLANVQFNSQATSFILFDNQFVLISAKKKLILI